MESVFLRALFFSMKKHWFFLLGFLSVLSSYGQKVHAKREFRGVWVATVVNIDWPSRNTLSVEQQKKEFLALLDTYRALNFNALIVQVRAAGDAFYASSFEPWSKYLTGQEGKAPDPYYDPLKWMIDQAHQTGFEFHAWFNPYRATFDLDTVALAENHAFNTHREWMLKYGKRFYFNPGLPEVVDYTTNVIMEVVNNYDIDAVHFDDYFYPYKIEGEVFQDSAAFVQYVGNIETIEDWRRANVDSLVKTISDSIRLVKPWVQFGISPFGVWRNRSDDPNGSDTQAGQTTYDDLYANPLKWAHEKWIDYLVPQLYWSMNHPLASHSKLVKWWSDQKISSNLYIGHGTYKVKNNSDKAWNRYKEIPKQIDLTREMSGVGGSVFFSAKSLMHRHKRLSKLIAKRKYKYPSLPPASPFEVSENHKVPAVTIASGNDESRIVAFKNIDPDARGVVVYGAKNQIEVDNPKYILGIHYVNGVEFHLDFKKQDIRQLNQLGFTYINKYGREGEMSFVKLKKGKLLSTNSK